MIKPLQLKTAVAFLLAVVCLRRGGDLKLRQKKHRFSFRIAAHFKRGLQPSTNGWPLWLAKYFTAKLFIELNTQNACRFAIGHAGNRAGDGRSGAAGCALWAALESHARISPYCVR
ncbi:hypothetical protein [Deefgea tanakiae]|uniref:hypothetical protein n=1 Tax=Deefgea tanakiae TaxID=2865840 RepID=UPI00402B3E1E